MYSSVNYIYQVVHYIPSSCLSYSCKFIPFDHLHLIPPFPPSASSSDKFGNFFLSVTEFVFEVQLTNNTMLAPGTQHSDSIFLYISKWSPWLSLVVICHHTKSYIIIEYNPPTVHFTSVTHLFCNWKFVPYNLPHLFSLPSIPHSSGNHLFVLSIYDCFCLILFTHMFCFSDFMCKWNHIVFIFRLISLNIISSRSNYVVITGKMLLFLWLIFHCMYIRHPLYPFIYWQIYPGCSHILAIV